MRRSIMLAGAVGLIAGCRYTPAVIPVVGEPAEITAIAGRWEGTYTADVTRRSGNITFRISPRGDSASGEVQMYLPDSRNVVVPLDRPAEHLLHAQSLQYLTVRFVAVGGGEVRGELEPYTSPECDCMVRTSFLGLVKNNVISGSFVTRTESSREWFGRWRVKHIKP
jgi:hypothetical protein